MSNNRERLIDRYINGRMGPAEQREFLARAESDPAFRRMLKAEQVIGKAIAKDRAAIPLVATEPSSAILAKLAATTPAGVGSAVAGSSTAGMAATGGAIAAGAGTGAAGSALFGNKVLHTVLALVAAGGVAVGTFMIAPILDRPASSTPPAAQSAGRTAPTGTPRVDRQPAPAAAAENGSLQTAAKPAAADNRRVESGAPAVARNNALRPSRGNEARATAAAAANASLANKPHRAANDPAPVEVENNRVNVNIKMDQGKGK